MTRTPAEILARLPGWEGASVTELSGGLSNQVWRVAVDERAAVLKIDDGPRESPFNTRGAEAALQKTAAAAGIAPDVLHAEDGVYLTAYVAGTVWSADRLDDEDSLEQLAAALQRLHALPLTGRVFDAAAAATRYVSAIGGADLRAVKLCQETVARQRLPQNLCCCHNDLVAENLISAPHLMFLDWEYACDNDPFFDLATIVEHHELDESRAAFLLDRYFGGNAARWMESLDRGRDLYLALLYLWLASRPDTDEAELAGVAARIATMHS